MTGASGGTGRGLAGPGTVAGSGDSTETGDDDTPTVWLPGGESDVLRADGTPTSGDASEVIGWGETRSGASGARVPVDEVLGEYRDEAVKSLDRGWIPPASRAMVQRYFDTIAGFAE